MRTMGHKDVKTAMQYQHPELEIMRAALDWDAAIEKRAYPDGVRAHSTAHLK
jgi:hypothetical protein